MTTRRRRLVRGSVLACALALAAASASAQQAARAGDPGAPDFHGGSSVAGGEATVLIGGQPAARLGDPTSCPQVCAVPTVPPIVVPHGAGTIVTGSGSVLIGGQPAARSGDTIREPALLPFPQCDPLHAVLIGSPTVLIGP